MVTDNDGEREVTRKGVLQRDAATFKYIKKKN